MTAGAADPAAGRACPTLVTPRLTLAAHGPADFDDVLAMWSDPAVVRFLGGVPGSRDEIWGRLLRYAGLWPLLGYGYWTIRETATGAFLGEAGLMEMRRAVSPPLEGTPEAGWALRPFAHGRGYAREAMAAILGWADATLAAPRLVCMIDPANAPSLALAARLGFAAFADTTYKSRPVRLLERRTP